MYHRTAATMWIAALLALLGSSGCRWSGAWLNPAPQAPAAFPPDATLDEIVRVVNGRSARIQQLQTTGASLSVPGLPSLSAEFVFARPQRVRLRAGTTITGPEVDIGSNDERFWIWIKRNTPPAVLYARHDEFARSPAARTVPIEPMWLAEALGVVEFDPRGQHTGPFRRRAGQLEIHSRIPTTSGEVMKITVLEPSTGIVLEQHLYDAEGKRLASTTASRHVYDPATDLALPREIELNLPQGPMTLRINVADYLVNRPRGESTNLWAMPRPQGYQLIDLARQGPSESPRPALSSQPTRLPQPAYETRGHDRRGPLRSRFGRRHLTQTPYDFYSSPR